MSQICSLCGSSDIKNHYYRHDLKLINIIKNNSEYIIDANLYDSILIDSKCTFPDCNRPKKLHPDSISHPFQTTPIYKRIIKLIIPDDTLCSICNINIKNHNNIDLYLGKDIQFHYFNYNIKILNTTEHDEVLLYNTDNKILNTLKYSKSL